MILAIILVIVSALLLDYLAKRRRYNLTKTIPGPPIFPFVGSLLFLTQRNIHDAVNNIIHYTTLYGPLVRVWGANQLMVVSINPKDLEIIMSSPKFITKGTMYNLMKAWLGDGLLLSSGHKWHQRRKIITPTFHFKILEQFIEVFDQQSKVLVDKLRIHASGRSFDIHPYITAAALDVIAETAMSTKLQAQSNPNSEYVRAVADITEILITRMANIFFKFDIIFKLFAPDLLKRQEKAGKILHNFTEKIIEQRRQSLLEQNGNIHMKEAEDDIGLKRRTTFLDVLLQSTIDGRPLTGVEIREEVDTFMFEGHDTTTAGIAFTLYCISRHADVQEKIFAEIRQICGDDKDDPVNLRKLQEMKYLELVIKESLRLFPPVPMIERSTVEDTNLYGRTIPTGTDIIIPIFVVSKNPDVFPEPEVFRPERHALENLEDKEPCPFAYIPFSAGPRNCIGQKFAMLELKSTVSKILRYYELLPLGEEPQVEMNIIMRSKNGVQLGLKPRVY